jgi:hypothetical protein
MIHEHRQQSSLLYFILTYVSPDSVVFFSVIPTVTAVVPTSPDGSKALSQLDRHFVFHIHAILDQDVTLFSVVDPSADCPYAKNEITFMNLLNASCENFH